MQEEILRFVKEHGLLLEKELFDLVEKMPPMIATQLLLALEKVTGQKFLTKAVLHRHLEYVQRAVSALPGENRNYVEQVRVKLGLSVEVTTQTEQAEMQETGKEREKKEQSETRYRIFYADTRATKKLEVGDFVGHYRSRYQQLQRVLLQRPELSNLITMNKLASNRQQVSVIGMVREKRVTKQKNVILVLEDMAGEVQALIRMDREGLVKAAQEVQLDDVIAVKASGNRDMLYVHELFFPDAFLAAKTMFQEACAVAFLSDVHCGSDRHLGKSFQRFLEWLRSGDAHARMIQYLFFVGDNVDGVGIFPGQEQVLKLRSMKEQYALLASYLRQVPKHMTMFMCPGQHDAVRVAEPQPLIERRYAPELYELENLILVTNPALVKLLDGEKEFNVLMYHGASIHSFINEIAELRISKAHATPAKAVTHMLKHRHLAPSHSSVVYIPHAQYDPLVIGEVPDVLCTGEVHRLDIESYNGVLVITGSCWQAQTPFEEKVGNVPDPCKVPVLNLKTRELKVYDFGIEEELHEYS